jgi:hypothetical protein
LALVDLETPPSGASQARALSKTSKAITTVVLVVVFKIDVRGVVTFDIEDQAL